MKYFSRMSLLALCCFCLGACEQERETLESQVLAFFQDLQAGNFEEAYQKISDAQKEQTERELQNILEAKDSQALKQLNQLMHTNFTLSTLAELSTEEYFRQALEGAMKNPEFKSFVRSKPKVEAQPYFFNDHKAEVVVNFEQEGVYSYRCVLENGSWKIQLQDLLDNNQN